MQNRDLGIEGAGQEKGCLSFVPQPPATCHPSSTEHLAQCLGPVKAAVELSFASVSCHLRVAAMQVTETRAQWLGGIIVMDSELHLCGQAAWQHPNSQVETYGAASRGRGARNMKAQDGRTQRYLDESPP